MSIRIKDLRNEATEIATNDFIAIDGVNHGTRKINKSNLIKQISDAVIVPTKTSDLDNDSGFITSNDIPAIPSKTSDLTNDSGFITDSAVPTKTSELTNDSGFITVSDVPSKTSDLTNDSGFITLNDVPAIPSKTSDLTNDSGFITASDIPSIPSKTSDLTNDSGFITANDVRQVPDPGVDQNRGKVLKVNSNDEPAWETESSGSGLPPSTPSDENKLLRVDSNGDAEWENPFKKSSFGTVITDGTNILTDEEGNPIFDENKIDLWSSYNGEGLGAERAIADVEGNNIAETYAKKSELPDGVPAIASGDEGKVLKVEQGSAVWGEGGGSGSGLPEITAQDEGKVLTVVSGEADWAEGGGGGGSSLPIPTPITPSWDDGDKKFSVRVPRNNEIFVAVLPDKGQVRVEVEVIPPTLGENEIYNFTVVIIKDWEISDDAWIYMDTGWVLQPANDSWDKDGSSMPNVYGNSTTKFVVLGNGYTMTTTGHFSG